MKKNATIYFYNDADAADYMAVFNGEAVHDDEAVHISYEEPDGTVMRVSVFPAFVSVNRIGELVYTLILEPGKAAAFKIQTPYGSFPLVVTPISIDAKLLSRSYDIRIAYEIKGGDESTAMNLRFYCDISE